jgi:hypothetical protein
MSLRSASLFLAYDDGSHVLLPLPVMEPAGPRTHVAPDTKFPRRRISPDPDVAALVTAFFSQPLRRISFLANAQAATWATRQGFFDYIDNLGQTVYERFKNTQKTIYAQVWEHHCASKPPLDDIDIDHYLDTNGGE